MNEIQFVQKHPLLKFEKHGDLIDLQFLGLNKVFKCTWTEEYGKSIEMEDDMLYYKRRYFQS